MNGKSDKTRERLAQPKTTEDAPNSSTIEMRWRLWKFQRNFAREQNRNQMYKHQLLLFTLSFYIRGNTVYLHKHRLYNWSTGTWFKVVEKKVNQSIYTMRSFCFNYLPNGKQLTFIFCINTTHGKARRKRTHSKWLTAENNSPYIQLVTRWCLFF